VIAYDRLIRDTPNLDYYATFDNFQVGVLQAQSIERAGAEGGQGPFNIELFGGSPDDNNAFFFYNGSMSVLQPYIDSGKLVVQSKQMGMDKVSTLRWDGATAQARMDNLLSAFYTTKKVDAVLSPYDGLSIGILSSLKGVGYGSGNMAMPIVSGQDAEVPRSNRCCAASSIPHLQGHPRPRQGHRRHGGRGTERQDRDGERHQDLQQWRQGGAVLSAQAGRRRQDQLGENPDRRRLLQEVPVQLRQTKTRRGSDRIAAAGNERHRVAELRSDGVMLGETK
jgi:ABC-type xylose transport system, periplasmic component